MARLHSYLAYTTTFFYALLSFFTVIIGVAVLENYFNILDETLYWKTFAACSFAVGFVTGFRIFKNFLHHKLNTYTDTLPTHKILIWCGWKYLIMSWYRPWLQEFFCDNFQMQHHIILIEMSKLPTHFGDIVTFLYMALSFVTMIIGVAVLQAYPSDSNAQLFMGTLFACFFIVGIVIGFRSFVNFLHRKLNTSTETLLTQKILIGCGGAYLIASVPCIGVFWWDEEDTGPRMRDLSSNVQYYNENP
ncbi:hypothetical protein CAEBREN_22444 [Caenorhabditis brenneri]|uniref:Uncharacterized protein n=1 Tax=Caenorhabditis brenneri TaxID=135651 RepID=G0PB01_CAEBE|nr:hypothetical protein CAEBREN_22444 [Caenorhabditis brenneri]